MASIDDIIVAEPSFFGKFRSKVERAGKSVAKYASITVLALSNYSCGDDFVGCQNDNDCRLPRICNTETYQCEEPAGNGGNDAGVTTSPCDNLEGDYLICEDFRNGPGIFNPDEADFPNGVYNYGPNGLEIINGTLMSQNIYFSNRFDYTLEFRWRTSTFDSEHTFAMGVGGEHGGECSSSVDAFQRTNYDGDYFFLDDELRASPSGVDITEWHTTKFIFSRSGQIRYELDGEFVGAINQEISNSCNRLGISFGTDDTDSNDDLLVDYVKLSED